MAPVTESGGQCMLTQLPFCTVKILDGEKIVQVIACGLNLLHKQAFYVLWTFKIQR